jgi:hypothetical protein
VERTMDETPERKEREPLIDGELTDEELKQVCGGVGSSGHGHNKGGSSCSTSCGGSSGGL